jgi:lysophospholipase L1-like esterase
MKLRFVFFALIAFMFLNFTFDSSKPTLFIIGDSTVKNGAGKGSDDMWGWGSLIHEFFDTTKISVENHAIGGRSSRTFLTDGRWEKILPKLKKGDFLLIQFGHNDNWAINDTLRARGTIRGVGNEIEEIDNLITKKHEVVHSFGWYLRKYVDETKAKSATPILCSLVPRSSWTEGKVNRSNDSYALWTKQVAESNNAFFIDLNELVSLEYEKEGELAVKSKYFTPKDNTHTNKAGAMLNATSVVSGLKKLKKCKLRKYLK